MRIFPRVFILILGLVFVDAGIVQEAWTVKFSREQTKNLAEVNGKRVVPEVVQTRRMSDVCKPCNGRKATGPRHRLKGN